MVWPIWAEYYGYGITIQMRRYDYVGGTGTFYARP